MKKTFLIIATLAGLASTASAASSPAENSPYVLPTYVVTAPRNTPAEYRVTESLKAFRDEAHRAVIVVPEPALPKVHPAIADRAAPRPKLVAKT